MTSRSRHFRLRPGETDEDGSRGEVLGERLEELEAEEVHLREALGLDG